MLHSPFLWQQAFTEHQELPDITAAKFAAESASSRRKSSREIELWHGP
jgi:hypothetical protein